MNQSLRTSKSREDLSRLLRASDGWITVEDAARTLGLERQAAAKRLARWAKQGWLKRVQRGHYAPIPLNRVDAETPIEEPWIAVPHLLPGGYVGGWTAAHHWDLTEQIFRDVCVFAPGRSRKLARGGATFEVFPSVSAETIGIRAHWAGSTRVPISDAERTLIDMLAQPRAGPGIQHVSDCLEEYAAAERANFDRLIEIAEKVGSGAVFKRLGFLLERTARASTSQLAACRDALTQGLAKLDPSVPCPRIVTRWRVRVPESWVLSAHD